ncbi:MAG TPA: hypothetical protein PLO23_03825, partial [Alphaproteobacteria bacterium]|nr:hypothetical protein [Alphaproteobacteria bacterium]
MALTSFLAKHAAPLALALTTAAAAQAAEPDYKEIRLQPSQAQQVENARKLIVCHERIMEDAFTRAVDKHKSTLKTLPRSEFEQRAAGEILEDLMYMEGTEDLSVPFEACNAEALGVGIDDIPRLTTAMKDLPDTPSADPEAAVAFLKKISEYHDFTSAHFDTRTMRDETPFVESRLAKKLAERIYDAPVTNAWALSACMDKAVRADIDAM